MIQKNWQELIKPSKIQIEAKGDQSRKANIIVEPLERGFGLTLGNALRRVLLSSLQGAAIVGMKAEGVVHEFSSLEGVREDEIRQNRLLQLRLLWICYQYLILA